MSMIGNLARISPAQREALHRAPGSIVPFLYPGQPPAQAGGRSLLDRLLRRRAPEPAPVTPLAEEDTIDVDKAWHVLHWLFTGTAWKGKFPEGFLVSCGTEVGNVDVGYGPARSFGPEEVRQIAAFLGSLDEAQLRARLDPKAMTAADIYPGFGGGGTFTEDEWEYVGDAFLALQQFVAETASRGMALLVYMS